VDDTIYRILLTYLLTPWSRVLLEKLATLQLVKKLPAFYGTRRFLTALTSARHLSIYRVYRMEIKLRITNESKAI